MTEDMEALEHFGVSVGAQTNGTVELLSFSLDNLFIHFTSYTQGRIKLPLLQKLALIWLLWEIVVMIKHRKRVLISG